MCPATPPTMAPLMHPLASADENEASASKQAEAKIAFMVVLPGQEGPTGQVAGERPVPSRSDATFRDLFVRRIPNYAHRRPDESDVDGIPRRPRSRAKLRPARRKC